MNQTRFAWTAAVMAGLLAGCGNAASPRSRSTDGPVLQIDAAPPALDAPRPDLPAPMDAGGTVYQRLGGENGIKAVVTDFVTRVVSDPKINGYFLNASVDGNNVIKCLVLQIGSLTGGPQTYPSGGCRDMKTVHAGMKISMQDFGDLAAHLVASLTAGGVAKADIDTIVGAITPMSGDIVEDRANSGTVYQRVGRKPAIGKVVDAFLTRVVADMRINGFFSKADAARLKTCLVRQVCGIDGPCKYGQEVMHPSEPGVGPDKPCLDMKTAHLGVTSPPGGGAGARKVGKADFDSLVEDLVTELDMAGVAAADRMAVVAALGPTCDDIVAGGVGCPGRTVIALTTASALVTFDTKQPAAVSTPVAVSGLAAGEKLVGLSLRPASGKLYALGNSSRVYEVNRTTGVATAAGMMPFSPTLDGTIFGFDFNPTVDRVRAVSDTQQNIRLHPDLGTVVGTDSTLNPPGGISAIAYTNSYAGALKTTLYGIDVLSNRLVRIGGPDGNPSPNTGALTDVGPLGVDPTGAAAFDILWMGGQNLAYAVFQVGAFSQFHTIDLQTGVATLVGAVGMGGSVAVRAIAVLP
jgi:truncated hemoglobin YjbI